MQQIITEEYKTRHDWVGKVIRLVTVQNIQIRPYEQMIYAQPRICPGEWDPQTPLGFWDPNGSPNLDQTTRPYYNQQKKRTYRIVNFAVRLIT